MDPALGVMSPFQRGAAGMDDALEDAVEALTHAPTAAVHSHPDASVGAATFEKAAEPPRGTECSFCAQSSTTRRVPKDGLYVCARCAAEQGTRPRVFPLGTFKCCPTSMEAADGDVVRCAGCHRWYHAHCVGITDSVLRSYVTLSTTAWYCPEPSCCERVLQKHLKK